MTDAESRAALYFLTEQACCLAQSSGRETDWFRACREAVEYLTGGDADAMEDFLTRTDAVEPASTEDYDTEEYEGKECDVRTAVSLLEHLSLDVGTPDSKRGPLKKAADLIAGFYGMD